MQFSLSKLLLAFTGIAIVLSLVLLCWQHPVASPWIVIPMLCVAPVLATHFKNKIRDDKKPLPIGNSLIISFCLWSIGFIIATQYVGFDGASRPIQYAQSGTAKHVFKLRFLVTIGLFILPVISLCVLVSLHLLKIPVRSDLVVLAITIYVLAVFCLIAHPRFIPMV